MTTTNAPALRIYDCLTTPNHWVIEDESAGSLHLVPAVADGWFDRRPYRGHRESLRPVTGYNFMGLGVPLRRRWDAVACDPEGRN